MGLSLLMYHISFETVHATYPESRLRELSVARGEDVETNWAKSLGRETKMESTTCHN